MKITKQLKKATFEYDEEKKTFIITGANESDGRIELNKVYAFAFMRFVVRMAQRNWFRSKKVVDKTNENMVDFIDDDHPDQVKMFNLK